MIIHSSVAPASVPVASTPAANSTATRPASVNNNEPSIPFLTRDGLDFPNEQDAAQGVASASHYILNQSNLALTSQANLSPDTVFSLLRD